MNLRVGIIIPPHIRCEELSRTLEQIGRLSPPPDEVLICADGCTDGRNALAQEAHDEVVVASAAEDRSELQTLTMTRSR